MPSASGAASSRGGDSGTLLKGSALKKTEQSVTVFVHAVREAPAQWDSALVMDFEETHGATAMALNKTNIGKLVELIGDDFDDWAGYEVTFEKVRVPNPAQGGRLVDGLVVSSAKKSKRKVPSDATA
jgi:hypothetical protein